MSKDLDVVRHVCKVLMIIVPAILAAWWSFGSAGLATLATLTLQTPSQLSLQDADATLRFRRNIQQHYRRYGIHLPIEDIVTISNEANPSDQLTFLMRKACGQGNIYIWVPLKVDLPVLGRRVFEWCWKTTL